MPAEWDSHDVLGEVVWTALALISVSVLVWIILRDILKGTVPASSSLGAAGSVFA
jgi:uncharacterized membrane-anchored protein